MILITEGSSRPDARGVPPRDLGRGVRSGQQVLREACIKDFFFFRRFPAIGEKYGKNAIRIWHILYSIFIWHSTLRKPQFTRRLALTV